MNADEESMPDPAERYARAALSILTDPGDAVLGALLRSSRPADVLEVVLSGCSDPAAALRGPGGVRGGAGHDDDGGCAPTASKLLINRAIERWRVRRSQVPSPAGLQAWEDAGLRMVCPGGAEWPTQLDDLGDARPVMLWLRGSTDLRFACLRSVSVVGSRAATAYGSHVATELSAELAGLGWTVISGGAFGVDACAHRGALAVSGCTVAVLASGLNFGYPKGNSDLFAAIAHTGVLVSECPPDRRPTRPGFLVRNRIIAALSRGTLVVEAAARSGALNTARHARELNRLIMAIPGPVTSEQSAGCHELIRESGAALVTGVRDIIEFLAPLGEDGAGPDRDPVLPAADLDPVTASVLRAVALRTGRGPATIATIAGVDLDTALRCLGLLAATGYVERCDQGWRVRTRLSIETSPTSAR